jgi:hypothetical protein
MFLRRVAFATSSAVLIFAAPAAASSTAAAGPSPTPLILEMILAAVVATGLAVRGPVSRAFASVRRTIGAPRTRTATTRARARV